MKIKKCIKQAAAKAAGGYVKEDPQGAAMQTGRTVPFSVSLPNSTAADLASGKSNRYTTLAQGKNTPSKNIHLATEKMINDKFGKIQHSFMNIRFIINDIVRGYIKEDDLQNTFNDIRKHLTTIYENINDINENIRDSNINADVVNNTMDAVGSSVVGVNTSIKKLNAGKAPDWFTKNVASIPNHFEIQVVYWLCIGAAKTFTLLIDKIRKMQENAESAKIKENFDIESLNLMSGIGQDVIDSIDNSAFKKKLISDTMQKVNPLAFSVFK